MDLPAQIHEQITILSKKGDALVEQEQYLEAIQHYGNALDLIPEPITDWEAATWLLVAIGDANFLSKNYEQAKDALSDAMQCPGAVGNPFIHMRLGQAHFELGDMARAADELARAYIPEGNAIFRNDDPKYLAFIKSKLKPPPGGWKEGW